MSLVVAGQLGPSCLVRGRPMERTVRGKVEVVVFKPQVLVPDADRRCPFPVTRTVALRMTICRVPVLRCSRHLQRRFLRIGSGDIDVEAWT